MEEQNITDDQVIDWIQDAVSAAGELKAIPKPVEPFINEANIVVDIVQGADGDLKYNIAQGVGVVAQGVTTAGGWLLTGTLAKAFALTGVGVPVGMTILYSGRAASIEIGIDVGEGAQELTLAALESQAFNEFENSVKLKLEKASSELREIGNELENYFFGDEAVVEIKGNKLTIKSDNSLTADQVQSIFDNLSASDRQELFGVKEQGEIKLESDSSTII